MPPIFLFSFPFNLNFIQGGGMNYDVVLSPILNMQLPFICIILYLSVSLEVVLTLESAASNGGFL